MSRLTLFEDNEIGVIRRAVARLQAEERLTVEQMRDLAQSLEWALDQGIVQDADRPAAGDPAEANQATTVVPLDYAAAARAVHLHLQEFCRKDLRYPDMIAEAARRAGVEIRALRQRLPAPADQSS